VDIMGYLYKFPLPESWESFIKEARSGRVKIWSELYWT
jgi:hypothetical protein